VNKEDFPSSSLESPLLRPAVEGGDKNLTIFHEEVNVLNRDRQIRMFTKTKW